MSSKKNDSELRSFHGDAKKAAAQGTSLKAFAKENGTLANNVKANLYEAVVNLGLEPVRFEPETPRQRRRSHLPDNVSKVSIYTGRAKVPYLTVKVPREIVASSKAADGDVIEWKINRRGDIVGENLTAREQVTNKA